MFNKTHVEYINSFHKSIKISQPMLISDWADSYRYLSSASSSEPGKWQTSRTPYLKEIMDCLTSVPPYHKIRRIAIMKGHQVGYTEGILMNFLGYLISHQPGPSMIVGPSEKNIKKIVQQKLEPMINDTPVVRGKISHFSRTTSRNTIIHKDFPGGFLVMCGANVAADLAGTSVKYLLIDEVDRFPADTQGEGSPVELAIGRTAAYNRRKIIMGSTPTYEESSVIAKWFEEGDQRYYFVPCPHCGHEQRLMMDNLVFDKNNIDEGVTYKCEKCEELIKESSKTMMLEAGEWRPTKEENISETFRSYHLNALYSPIGFLSWIDVAKAKMKAERDDNYAKTFQNLYLGLPCTQAADEFPSSHVLYRKGGRYDEGKVPTLDGVTPKFLLAGVDVQGDRLEVLVTAWHRKVCFVVEHIVLWGNTNVDPHESPWQELTDVLNTKYGDYGITKLAIDSGFIPYRVFSWKRSVLDHHKRIQVIRGVWDMDGIISYPKIMEVSVYSGKKSRVGNKYQDVNTHFLKSEIYKRLLIESDEVTDTHIFFPKGKDREFYEQLCAERMVLPDTHDPMDRTGRIRYRWKAVRERNEILDLMVYNFAMWYGCNAAKYAHTEDKWSRFVEIKSFTG